MMWMVVGEEHGHGQIAHKLDKTHHCQGRQCLNMSCNRTFIVLNLFHRVTNNTDARTLITSLSRDARDERDERDIRFKKR